MKLHYSKPLLVGKKLKYYEHGGDTHYVWASRTATHHRDEHGNEHQLYDVNPEDPGETSDEEVDEGSRTPPKNARESPESDDDSDIESADSQSGESSSEGGGDEGNEEGSDSGE
jgi:hypothetical protein